MGGVGGQGLLYCLLGGGQTPSADEKRSDFRQGYAALPINDSHQSLRDAAPDIDREAVTGANDVIGANGKIHGNGSRIIRSVAEDLQAKKLNWPLAPRRFTIHFLERWHLSVG